MSKLALLNIKGEKIKDINIKDEIWNITPNDQVLYDAITLQQASLRQGSHKVKTRGEVSGGGRKPWRQKGTGRARQGSIRSPQWRGGGIVFGPTTLKNYTKKMNKKERRLALKTALTYKFKGKELKIIDEIFLDDNKTKTAIETLNNLKLNDKTLFVTNEYNENLNLSTRNLKDVNVIESKGINVLDIVKSTYLVLTLEALKQIEEDFK